MTESDGILATVVTALTEAPAPTVQLGTEAPARPEPTVQQATVQQATVQPGTEAPARPEPTVQQASGRRALTVPVASEARGA